MNLSPDTLLKRANGINISVDSAHVVDVTVNNQRASFSNLALDILSVFSQPLTMQDGLKKLEVSGVQNWVELTSTIGKLWVLGALCNFNETPFLSDKNFASFGSSPIHIAMLNDRERTDMFTNAIQSVVKKGDVVIDIGTGTGVLAIAAAKAGAGRVYAIETGAIADVAQKVIEGTEYADRITLIRGWSTQIELPKKADVLVSEIIGNDPFDENVLQVFMDARKRLLKSHACIVPHNIKVIGLPVNIPEKMLRNRIVHDQDLKNWLEWYGSDFSALKNINADLSIHLININARNVDDLIIHDQPITLADVDFKTFSEPRIDNYVRVKAEAAFNGILVYFDLGLGDEILSSRPGCADRNNHWVNFVWYLPQAAELNKGDDYTIHYKYAGGRDSEIRLLFSNQEQAK